jgi:hypothetical protein
MIRKSVLGVITVVIFSLSFHNSVQAQSSQGAIVGHVSDSAGAVVQRARVELQPGAVVATTDQSGDFTISGLAPGEYTLTVSYVGFSIFSNRVSLPPGNPIRVNAVLQLGTQNEAVTVHADREGGEVEALDIDAVDL